jgi:hypothetical protein
MEGFTSADAWAKLTNAERIEHCRIAAREAEASAKSAAPALREVYTTLAAKWLVLADQLESHAGSAHQAQSG